MVSKDNYGWYIFSVCSPMLGVANGLCMYATMLNKPVFVVVF